MQFSAVLLTLGTLVSTVDVILAVATIYCVCASTWLLCMAQTLVTLSRLLDEKQPLFTNFETMPLCTVLVLISSDCCI
jgi:hypothetical protein